MFQKNWNNVLCFARYEVLHLLFSFLKKKMKEKENFRLHMRGDRWLNRFPMNYTDRISKKFGVLKK